MNLPGRDQGAKHFPGWRVHPAPDGRGAPPKPPTPTPAHHWRRLAALAVVLLGFNYWIASMVTTANPRLTIPYSPTFLQTVQAGNVVSVTFSGDSIQGDFARPVRYPASTGKTSTRFSTRQPPAPGDPTLIASLKAHKVAINAKRATTGSSLLGSVLIGFGPTILFVGLLIWFMRRAAANAGGGLLGIGKSRAHRYEETGAHVSFADVAGIDEARDELTQIVDFLKHPDKYRKLGGRIPRGVLLSGLPGTGKTLLARAVAGEAGVPFFSMSASEFIEMIVGVGASRVRDLFEQAKLAAPAIIFIDELDAIGRSRSNVAGFGGSDEREQTLNQILTEMDGFTPATGVIVIAATNRPDVLDAALLRAGRFDRRVAVQPPDRGGREAILAVHTRGMPLADDVDLGAIAATTPGMVGADLANVANEAALLAARRDHERVAMGDFTDALERTVLGTERKLVLSVADRERTAYHEAGHALVGMLTPGADPVRKISIIPRGVALGVTFSAPDADRYSYSRDFLIGKIRVALGGRGAEQLIYGEITTGAESDIQQLTQIARQMVGRWGMSEAIGPVSVMLAEGQGPIFPGASETAPETLKLVDDEVRRIIEDAGRAVAALLADHRPELEALARALVAAETLEGPDAYAVVGIPQPVIVEPIALPDHVGARPPAVVVAVAGAETARRDSGT